LLTTALRIPVRIRREVVGEGYRHSIEAAEKLKNRSGKARGAVLLLIDEADALAQSRENAQMHHEDRAGVNALIRGIDRIANQKLPAAVLMCTNRLKALDPAVQRRAAEVLTFGRPDETQRRYLLTTKLQGIGLGVQAIDELVKLTGPRAVDAPGFTFSDINQRLIPAIILSAYPHTAVDARKALLTAKAMSPTPAFQDR
jgi:AAA+ superfamily predicted ATPase